MEFQIDWPTAGAVVGVVALAGGMFAWGHHMGSDNVLDSAVLQAQNEITHQIVTVQSQAPSPELMTAANQVCEEEQDNSFDDCMTGFLDRYGDVWLVDLVAGTRTLLTPEALGR